MRFLEFTARRIARRVILAAIELDGLAVYNGYKRRIDAEAVKAAYATLDAMHYSEPVYGFGERLRIIFAGPFMLLCARAMIKVYRTVIRYKAEEAKQPLLPFYLSAQQNYIF